MQEQATRKSYGPYSVKGAAGPIPAEFFSLPWVAVKGANVLVAVTDDMDINPASAGNLSSQLLVASEVTIFGVIQGFATPLKTALLTGKTGPVSIVFPWEEGWEYIRFTQRLMNGGRPLTPPGGSAAAQAALLINVALSIYVMPRGGFKEVVNG
jgi:hypothetical protein